MISFGKRRPTMADVAKLAGVGIATVDRVFTGRRKVREENIRRVYDAAEELGYHATPVIRYRLNREAPRMVFGFVLPKEHQAFYRDLSAALSSQIDEHRGVRGRTIIRYARTQNPQEYADLLNEIAETADVVAASAVNHGTVGRAVNDLHEASIPVFSMLNDFAQSTRRKFVGLDNFRAGRLAGWMLANIIREPGTIAVAVGGNLWQAHQLRESGLRSFLREKAPQLNVRDAVLNLETRQITHDMVLDIVESWHDLRGIYITGGGAEGAIEALRETTVPGQIPLIVHPLTDETRAALIDGQVSMVIGTPVVQLAQKIVTEMVAAHLGSESGTGSQILLRPELLLPEYP